MCNINSKWTTAWMTKQTNTPTFQTQTLAQCQLNVSHSVDPQHL